MPKITDTYERAYAACSALAAAGINPTVRSVAQSIGTNSPSVISKAIQDWKRSTAAESLRRLEIPDVPDQVAVAATLLWRSAMEAAMASLAQQSQALEAEREDWQKRIEAAEEELSDSKSALAALNEQTCEEIRALRDQLDAGAKQAGQLRIDLSETTQAFAAAREDLASKTAALDEARRAMEQQKLEWAEKYDKSHTWHLMRIAEERSLALAASEAEIARLKDALAQSRQNVTMLDGHLARSAAANADIRAELKNLREENAALKDLKRERRGHGKKPANLKIVRRS